MRIGRGDRISWLLLGIVIGCLIPNIAVLVTTGSWAPLLIVAPFFLMLLFSSDEDRLTDDQAQRKS